MKFIFWAIIIFIGTVGYALAETGVTLTREMPFIEESISQVKEKDSSPPAFTSAPEVIPFQKSFSHGIISSKSDTPTSDNNLRNFAPLASSVNPLAPLLINNFSGLDDNNKAIPPDTQGAVGPEYLVEALNSELAFFKKITGELVTKLSMQSFWASFGTSKDQPANHVFDPKVIYDQYSKRFIMIIIGNSASPNSWILLAVSKNSDPTGDWYKWAIDADTDAGMQTYSNWADYPGLGIDANAIYLTANMFNDSNEYQYSKIWFIPKTQTLTGSSNLSLTEFRDPAGAGFAMQPAHVFGDSSAEYFVCEGDFSTDSLSRKYIQMASITLNGETPTWSDLGVIEVFPYPFKELPKAPQSGDNRLIETNDSRLTNVVYRNGYIWTTHTVESNNNSTTEVAWYQLDPALARSAPPYKNPVHQGRISDPSRWYYFPSIAVNANGDVGLGFNGSSTNDFVSSYFTILNSLDLTNTSPVVILLKAGLASYYKVFNDTINHWGDYSATVIDPDDDQTFWTVQEHASTRVENFDRWGTWWGKFTLGNADLSLTMTDSIDPIKLGVNLEYSLTLTNKGPNLTGRVILEDILPAETTFISVNSTIGQCSETKKTITCNIGDMAENLEVKVTIISKVQGPAGTITNTAKISSALFDPDQTNNTVSEKTTIKINNPPIAKNQSITLNEDESITFMILAEDEDKDKLSYLILSQPSHGVLSDNTPSITYIPDLNYHGPDSFSFKANDEITDSNIATIDINVIAINDPPVVEKQKITTDEDNTTTITLTGKDIDGNELNWTIVNKPLNGSLSGTGSDLTYLPHPNYHGPDSFSFKANDGTVDSNIPIVNITINAINDAPQANLQAVDLSEDTSIIITLTADDADSDPLIWTIVSEPTHGKIEGLAPNLNYIPNKNYHELDNFDFKVNDGKIDSNIAAVEIKTNSVTEKNPNFSRINIDKDSPATQNRIDGFDLIKLGSAFGFSAGETKWDFPADINDDDIIDGTDLSFMAAIFGKKID